MDIPVTCFVPCCSEKGGFGRAVDRPYEWPPTELREVWAKLDTARRAMEHCIDCRSSSIPALQVYTGHFYSVPGLKETVEGLVRTGTLRLFITSAGYGILDAWEAARKYDTKMQGQFAAYWLNQGRVDIIVEVRLRLSPSQVYGFFAGTTSWPGAGAKYRCFFTDGLRKALSMA